MTKIRFRVDGIPKGQPRPRAFARGGRAAVYDPGTAEGWKSLVALAWREAGRPAFAAPVHVKLWFQMPMPKSMLRKDGTPNPAKARNYHTGKPDCDNLAKAVLDALTQIGAWRDDAEVAALVVTKSYVPDQPGAIIELTQLEP